LLHGREVLQLPVSLLLALLLLHTAVSGHQSERRSGRTHSIPLALVT